MHGLANPARFLRFARWLTPLLLVSGLVVAGATLAWGLLLSPAESLQGDSVRILYLHVPTAWLAMAGWGTIALASLAELVWRHPLAGIAARAAAVPGAVYCAICLATGSLWGKYAWGTWWVWDGRVTSVLVLLFLYFGYISLAAAAETAGRSRIAAIFGLVGVVNIPIIHYSVLWWNSLHQPPSITTGGSAMSAEFLIGLLIASLGFTLIFAGVVLARMRALLAEQQSEARLRRKAMAATGLG